MKRVWLGQTMVEYLHESQDPKPVPLNTFVLVAMGFVRKGSVYNKGDVSVTYDGCDWWFAANGYDHQQQDYLMKTGVRTGRCNTVDELEKMLV